MKHSCYKSSYLFLLPALLLINSFQVQASTDLDALDTPVFEPIPIQNFDAGQLIEFRVAASQAGIEPPWISTDFFDFGSRLSDNGDGTRTFSWRSGPEDIGQHVVSFLARNSNDPTVQSTMDVVINVLPVLNTGPDLRIIAPDNYPIEPGQFVSIRILAVDSSGEVPSLWINEEFQGNDTLDDNGDGTRTYNWQVPETITSGPFGLSFETEFLAASASNPDVVVTHSLFLDFIPDEAVTDEVTLTPSLILPTVTAVAAGERIAFRVAGITPSGQVANLRVSPLFEGVSFEDNGDGTRTFIWMTSPVDAGDWPFVFSAEDPADRSITEETVVISVAG